VSWRVASACDIGTSHIASGKPCEDSCWAQVHSNAAGEPVLSIFVADGAGSALHGGEGAELAIQAAADFLTDKLAAIEFGLSDDLAVECVMKVRDCIYAKAEAAGLNAREFACTFLGVVSTLRSTLVLQIGDGAVALDVGQGLQIPIVPMSGEYANMTHFVTDEGAVEVLVTKKFDAPAIRVAVFSDGIQRLAMDMASNTAHEPFFAPFFRVLAGSTPDQDDQLESALVKFLGSPAVNERTDDDKTLALAVLVP
jgi:hypothetical protein